MSEFVVIRMPGPSADSAEWITVDETGVCLDQPRSGELDAAAQEAAGRKVIGLVPAFSVLRTDTDIPVRSTAKLLKALPFAMEEQLAEDVDELHFASGRRDADGRLPVAVVQKSEMDAWLDRLADAGLDAAGLYSDGDALGDIPGTTVMLVEPGRVTLRDVDGSVAVADRESLDAVTELWLAGRQTDDDDAPTEPVNLLVYTTPDSHGSLETFLAEIHERVDTLDVKLQPDGALPRMASQIVVNNGVNLLQGDYARRSNLGMYWPAWQVAAMLLLGLVGALTGYKALEIMQLNRHVAALDTAIEQAFRYTFPGIGEIRDPQSLLESKLRELGASSGSGNRSPFLDTMKTVAIAVSESAGADTKVETINYRSGVMELRVRAPSVESLDAIRKAIVEDTGLSAEIQSANPEGDKVLGRLQIRGSGV